MMHIVFWLTVLSMLLPAAVIGQDAENGEVLYEENCTVCHGQDGAGLIAPSLIDCSICNSFDDLVDFITINHASIGCTGDCGDDTAAYIYETLNGNTTGVPGTVTLISPSGTVTEESPGFTWTADSAATWYKLWIGSGSHRIFRQWYEADECTGTDTCTITPDYSLPDGDWTWSVKTWNESGTGGWSDSLSISVSTGLTLPSAATLISPDGTAANFVTFTWEAVSDATYYYLWVDDDSGSNRIKKWYTAEECGCGGGESQCGITTDVSLDAGGYTWYIQTWNDIGFGFWSSGTDFTVTE
ncbi:MAG: hypothetical protein MI892_18305 [Desulfobacterales bacterium]|nr:hypothetical protein [Desulfobacterales bacterium]